MATSPTSPRLDVTHVLTSFNTIEVPSGTVVKLVTPYAGPYYYNVYNLGPSSLWIRADDDPFQDDPESELLPPGCADNLIVVPEGTEGLRFVAGLPGGIAPHHSKMTVRLVRG